MNSRPQLHVSMLNTLSKCGIQFQRRYGARFGIWPTEEKTPLNLNLIVGIAVHKVIEKNFRQLMASKILMPTDQVADVTRDEFGRLCDGEIAFDEDEAVNPKVAVETARDKAISLSTLHSAEAAPRIRPIDVEQAWVINLDGYPIDLAGQYDIIEADGIRDSKTTARTPKPDVIRSLQMAMYSQAYFVLKGEWPKRVTLDYLIALKTPKYLPISDVPQKSWVSPLFRRIERFVQIIDAVKAGHQAMTPADPDHWACSKKYCAYWESCEFWSGR